MQSAIAKRMSPMYVAGSHIMAGCELARMVRLAVLVEMPLASGNRTKTQELNYEVEVINGCRLWNIRGIAEGRGRIPPGYGLPKRRRSK